MTKDKILIDLLTIKARGGGAEEVKEYIMNLMNSLPGGDIVQKHRRAAGAIMAYGSYERGLFGEELLAEMLEKIVNS
ncbi:hypothetical protein A2773_01355 [Candidatus Gottesmanbacteria bacterium RIFCSPHIGHO2_01_FULL_39_10]|uniref:Uncharacterized protein n=1 Tax=Candidatus Gottesmanbacteria bacterium RIFCSPHIGHO2_01_FULL_39_10 TaxID=1798375 RepID=A0A1F5ZS55_9BACT|nr:MAG: hypothetical protein A2773_01355 [Candidatus Gottesmanbacteria bacterium RIFCSPHIGHO2_01_FULL_39_10]